MTGLDRLHEIAEDVGRTAWLRDLGAALHDTLDAIEREARDLSGYESDVLAWVEKNGGLDAVKERTMPEGMEWLVEAWPRFEDDAPVRLGDMALIDGYPDMVEAVQLWIHGKPVIYGDNSSQQLEKGERVKRPEILAADGEPLEVGQTVWGVEDGKEFEVVNVNGELPLLKYGETAYTATEPEHLTHQRPVLDADGVPIKVGDTVYFTDGREQECNTVVHAKYDYKDEPYVQLGRLNEVGYPTYTNCSCIDPSQLTHERPDSWERLEDDATLPAATYCESMGIADDGGCSPEELMARDLVRRAKALAGVSE